MIDYQKFVEWSEKFFTDVDTDGEEVKMSSPFIEDRHHHLWCNPSKNAFHCWKSDRSGNLYELVVIMQKCSYADAISILGAPNPIRDLEKKVLDKLYTEPPPAHLSLPPHTYLITSLAESNLDRRRAEQYLHNRRLSSTGLYICVAGEYRNRIIIPYYGRDGELIYFNARDLGSTGLRYMGPSKEVGIGKKDVLWFKRFPKRGEKFYLTEGEFDAMSLCNCGINAGACGGKNLHAKQLALLGYDMLATYRICLALDSDKSGLDALNKIGHNLIRVGVHEVSYVYTPPSYKDWNEMLIKEGDRMVILYIKEKETLLDQDSALILKDRLRDKHEKPKE